MRSLESIRKDIDRIDEQMTDLFCQRMQAVREVAAYKMERGLPVEDAAREREMLLRRSQTVADPELREYYLPFLSHTMEVSKNYQSRILQGRKVAFSGVPGAFAQIAAEAMLPGCRTVACPDFAAAYHGVETGAYDCAVLPVENNYAGVVGAVMDMLFCGTLYVNQVIELPVRHELLVNPGASMDQIQTVVSHPQALDQCAELIRAHGWQTQSFANTAAAAEYIKTSGRTDMAAIASQKTAELLDLQVLQSAVQDVDGNVTRFACLSRCPNEPGAFAGREENFILNFTVPNRAGALAQTLNIIGAHGFNMRNLRSRPLKDLQWNYYFYVEIEGNVYSPDGQDLLRELAAVCAHLKLVGNFCS